MSMMLLSGTLTGVDLQALVRLLAQLDRTGRLEMSCNGWLGSLCFEDGRVVSASLHAQRGADALRALARQPGAVSFAFHSNCPRPNEHGAVLDSTALLALLSQPAGYEATTPALEAMPRSIVSNQATAEGRAFRPQPALFETCPHLGIDNSSAPASETPTSLHRCYLGALPLRPSLIHQREFCVSGQFRTCPRLLGLPADRSMLAALPSGQADRVHAGGVHSRVSEPMSTWRARVARINSPQMAAATAVAILILGIVVGVVVREPSAMPGPGEATVPLGPPLRTPAAVDLAARETVQPTPASAPKALATHSVFDEKFANETAGWPNEPAGPAVLGQGSYRLTPRQSNQFVAVGAPLSQVFGDVVVTAVFRKLSGPPGGGYGIIVRDQGPGPRDGVNQLGRYYVLEIGDKGEVGIWRRADDQWIEVLPWTFAQAVHPGNAANEVVVQAIGDQLTLLVNGFEVTARHDGALAYGKVGVFVGGDFNQVMLDQFRVSSVQ